MHLHWKKTWKRMTLWLQHWWNMSACMTTNKFYTVPSCDQHLRACCCVNPWPDSEGSEAQSILWHLCRLFSRQPALQGLCHLIYRFASSKPILCSHLRFLSVSHNYMSSIYMQPDCSGCVYSRQRNEASCLRTPPYAEFQALLFSVTCIVSG